MFLGHKLKKLRESKGLTQEELATKLHKSRGYIGDIENGRRPYLRDSTVAQFAKFFCVNPDFFYTENAYLLNELTPHLSDEDRDFILSLDSTPFITLARNIKEQELTPEQIRAVMLAIKQVADPKNK
jgi:Predicted transcriptional regulators